MFLFEIEISSMISYEFLTMFLYIRGKKLSKKIL